MSSQALALAWDLVTERGADVPVVTGRKDTAEPDPDLRDGENVPLPGAVPTFEADPAERVASPAYREAVDSFMAAAVLPYAPEAWVDHSKTRVGYELPVTRHFYRYSPPRGLDAIDSEVFSLEAQIQTILDDIPR
jgi:type I restriction enzyme M protein